MQTSLYDRVFNNSNVFIIETSAKAADTIVSITPNVATVIGYDSEQLINKATTFSDLIHEDDVAQFLVSNQHGLLGDVYDEVVHDPYRLITSEGKIIWVKDAAQYIRVNRKTERVVHVLSDITQEVLANEAVMVQKQRLLNVLQSAGFGLWEWNSDDDFLVCDKNWSHLMGFLQEINRLKLNRFIAMLHPSDISPFRQALDTLASGKESKLQIEIRIRHLSGKWRYHSCTGVSTPLDYGQGFLVSMSHSDITSQKENELSAIAALSTRNQFFARVSHEIRTPLHGILGMLELLKQDDLTPRTIEKVNKVFLSSEHLMFLLNDILDLAKLNEAKLSVSLMPTSIKDAVTQVERLFASQAKEKNIELKIDVSEHANDVIVTDQVRLTQILSNLVSNAIKFTHIGEVKVSTLVVEDDLMLVVSDTGVGIKNKSDVFEAYLQEQSSLSDTQVGTGLGLEIVKKLCELLDIEISLESTITGTTFTLNLGKPVDSELDNKANTTQKSIEHIDLNALQVLIVDDSSLNREIVKEVLENKGALCAEAEDGYQSVKMVRTQKSFDVILMDKHMPNMDGFEATEQIRQEKDLMHQPIIIALTADTFDTDTEKWFALGVNDIMTKPFEMDALVKTIDRCINPL